MSGIEIGALCVVGAFLLFAAVRLFRGPVKLALRVLVNSALGFGAVWLPPSPASGWGSTCSTPSSSGCWVFPASACCCCCNGC